MVGPAGRWRLGRAMAVGILGLALASCADESIRVVVDVQTDLVPGLEFQSIRTELGDDADGRAVTFEDDLQAGVRAAEIEDVPIGETELSVILLDAGGELVLRRDLALDVQESLGLTVVLTRNCLGVECTDGSEGSAPTTCLDGRCVPRECSSASAAACGTPGCEVRADCAVGVECAVPDCVQGVCLAFGDAARCAADELCHPDTGCVPRPIDGADEDGDGVLDSADCDPTDPSVGFRSERSCASDCATGIETCVSGEWTPCDAPTDCTCVDGEMRDVSCGQCGTITQVCADGVWDSGACMGQGACVPGTFEDVGSCARCGTERRTCLDDCSWDAPSCTSQRACEAGATEMESESCGVCGESRTRERTCSPSCDWGAWSAYSACEVTMGCMPGALEMETQACGDCGTRERQRTCSAGCVFGPWGAWGACAGEGCAPSTPEVETRACGSCGAGMEQRSRTCTSACAWGAWSSWGACSTPTVVSLRAGFATTFFVRSDGSLWGTGANDTGQRGTTGPSAPVSPIRVGSGSGWTAVDSDGQFDAAGMALPGHSCGIQSGELYCWGRNADGQLGQGATSAPVSAPTRVGADSDWTHVSAGIESTCGIRSGELYCWGRGAEGRLGLGDTLDALAPTRVGSASDWTSISVGWTHACGLRAGGALFCWGQGDEGRVGNGADADVLSPVSIPGTWSDVAAGHRHTCGVQSGQLHCWGRNSVGQLGLGGAGGSTELTPQRVGTDADWSRVAAGEDHSCGIRAGGQLFCFGGGGQGQLGDGASTNSNVPVRVGTEVDWATITAGSFYSCGVRSGSSFCWGRGGLGRLGLGDSMGRTTPAEACF